MKRLSGFLLLVLACGCINAATSKEELPPATDEVVIPVTTSFEECAKYYPVMESYPMQCTDPIANKTFTQEINVVECSEGEVITSICPDGKTSYQSSNCVDGKWHQVMYIRDPCGPLEEGEATEPEEPRTLANPGR